MNRVFKKQEEVVDRLAQLGFTEEMLRDVVKVGLLGWLSCTENHPPSFPGIFAWAEMIRSLRESLLPFRWDRVNDRNLPLTANPETRIAITASSGDEYTGIENASPCTRNPKGNTTKERAEANAIQLGLFADMTEPAEELIAEAKRWQTWLLLSHRDRDARVVRCELSLPITIGSDGRVDGWDERIILGEIPFDDDLISVSSDGGGGNSSGRNSDGSLGLDSQSELVDVQVKRRA